MAASQLEYCPLVGGWLCITVRVLPRRGGWLCITVRVLPRRGGWLCITVRVLPPGGRMSYTISAGVSVFVFLLVV